MNSSDQETTPRYVRPDDELERFFSVSLDMLCISHADGFFKRLSPAFTRTLGWSLEEMLTMPYVDFVHPDDLEATIAEVQRQVQSGEMVLQFVNRYRHKDGSYRTLSWKSVPQEGGFMYAAARDITEQTEMELALRQAKEEAEMANHAKSEFLSRMSHELRTPLNAVLGYAQLLNMQYDDPRIQEATHSILKGGKHLLNMINEILDLSRIESGNLAISEEPVAVAEVLHHAIALMEPIAKSARVTIQIEGTVCDGLHVQADRQRLQQILLNLLNNAIKYNHPEGKITIRCHEGEPGFSRIEIQDTGHGISGPDQKLLFQPFQRFGDKGIEGTGLGLALSLRFAQMMGGDIQLVESSASGSTFSIQLKTVQAEYQKVEIPAAVAEARESTAQGTILYIEDNLSNLRLLEMAFADRPGLNLISAIQGGLGLEMAREHKPDLILLDLHLPDLMGDEVLRRLKADPETCTIPVVMLSADATHSQIRKLRAGGALDYFTKPVDLKRLLEIVSEQLPS